MLNQNTGSDQSRGTIPRYSVEKPIAGATMAYNGRNAMVNTREPGMARMLIILERNVQKALNTKHEPATVYFVHKLASKNYD